MFSGVEDDPITFELLRARNEKQKLENEQPLLMKAQQKQNMNNETSQVDNKILAETP